MVNMGKRMKRLVRGMRLFALIMFPYYIICVSLGTCCSLLIFKGIPTFVLSINTDIFHALTF